MIEVHELHKAFGAVKAVNGVSFAARDGEITGLLGPNGAGKTTTLRMLYTLMKPDSGNVLIDGLDVAHDAPAVRRRLGVLPDARGLYKRLTARENIDYFARLQGLDAATRRNRSEALIDALDMSDIADRRTEGFSQGQRVKTAIARALVHDPRNVILDEPTNGLDPAGMAEMRDFIRELGQGQRTVLLSSHLMNEVEQICDRVGVIRRGRLVAEGTVADLRGKPGLRIRALPLDAAHQVLSAMPEVEEIEIVDGGLRIAAAPAAAPALTRALVGAGIDVNELVIQRSSLEDVFLHLTQDGAPQA